MKRRNGAVMCPACYGTTGAHTLADPDDDDELDSLIEASMRGDVVIEWVD